MGHYASEMACSKCGHLNCTCAHEAAVNTNWIVDDDYMPIRVVDFDKKYGTTETKMGLKLPAMPWLRRQYRKQYPTEIEAYNHGTAMLHLAIEENDKRGDRLRALLENR